MSKAEVKWRPSFRCSDFFHRQHSYGKTKGFLQQHSRIWPITLVSSKASRNGGTFLFPDRNHSPYVLKTVNILVMASWSLAFWVWGISSPPAGQSVSEAHLQSLSFHFSGPLKDSIRIYFPVLGFLYHWLSDKEPTCQCRRHRFYPWVRKIPRRRKWQPTPIFLPGKSHGQRSLAGYSL